MRYRYKAHTLAWRLRSGNFLNMELEAMCRMKPQSGVLAVIGYTTKLLYSFPAFIRHLESVPRYLGMIAVLVLSVLVKYEG